MKVKIKKRFLRERIEEEPALEWEDPRLQSQIDAALEELWQFRIENAPTKKRSEYHKRTEEDDEYEAGIKKIWAEYLEGTGWTEEDVMEKLEMNAIEK